MQYLPAIVRIIIGIALLAIAGSLYSSSKQPVSDGQERSVQVLGIATSLPASQVTLIYAGAGIVGLLFIAFGVVSALRQKG